ncbi:MAG: hypothetical protein D6710_07175 [Nitrospirae bacterium]|nr:MAG: hypothetical protein D6710_07175 [Nitrospirota bacterium]
MEALTSTVTRDEFLRLFTTQLRYQDPLNPLESKEFTAQLAQFSSLEQLININDNINGLKDYQKTLNQAFSTNLIGRSVRAEGEWLSYRGSPVEFSYSVDEPLNSLTINIYSETGELVKSIDLGPVEQGKRSYIWDGTDSQGNQVGEGRYRLDLIGINKEGTPVEISTEVDSLITGVDLQDGSISLILENGTRVSLGEIKTITQGGA